MCLRIVKMACSEKMLVFLALLFCIAVPCFSHSKGSSHRSKNKETLCGYQSCHQTVPNKLNVHLIPHSHDDVGWLKTVDQYYYGEKSNIRNACVQCIIDTVIQSLWDNPDRRFIYVETAYFWKWWQQQTEAKQKQVKTLVNEGRLEFAGGAWSMNDEATTNYQSTIDQFTWGLRRLNDSFGACGHPHVGWQIDPFGHSREMASILARLGFDGLFFARLDYQDKQKRIQDKTLEMVWKGSPNLGAEADLFTSVLYNHYSAPPGFCFDTSCDNEPFIDDKTSPYYNVDGKVADFVSYVKNQAEHYTSNHILVPMGDDFNYQHADMYFKNIDKLVRYTNEISPDVHVLYSTPSCYLKALNEEGKTYETKQDDFFPYGSDFESYWTGFYTSRPALKYFERLSNNFLQCEVTENETNFVVTVYNPLSWNISHYVRFPVKPGQYEIKNSKGTVVKLQLVPIPESVLAVPGKGDTDAKLDLVFKAENIPPMGYQSYHVSLINNSSIPVTPSGDLFIGSEETILLTLKNTSGLVRDVISRGVRIPLKQNFLYYAGACNRRESGAYVFRPNPNDPELKPETWLMKSIRHIQTGPLNIEAVSVFTTNLATYTLFYTDSNGRELLTRQRDSRPTWAVNLTERVSGNYYPVTSRIVIRDGNNGNEVAILNDRSQGGSSINNGEIELMLYRRTLSDDEFGVDEPLNEQAYGKPLVVRGKHYLVVGNANANNSSPMMAAVERELALKKLLQPWLFFTKTALNFNQWQSSHKMEFAGLTRNLPSNIHILTLEPWKENELLLRLEHIMEKNEDPELSKPVEVNLQDLFNTFTITEIHETNLAGNQWKEDMNRLVWKTGTERMKSSKPLHKGPIVTLKPMDILTYVIKVQRKTTIPDYTSENGSRRMCLRSIKMISSQKMLAFVVLLFCITVPCFSYPTGSSHHSLNKENLCGYQSCHQTVPNKLNVHLIPHSHDDVGWLKTVDQYYYGAFNNIQKAGVQYILDTVTQSLSDNPDRRFIYVETAFFWKWWLEQSEAKQEEVKMLVNEGRLEFAGGAWSMNDEATTNYQSTIDQFTWGLRKLNDTFGACGLPHVGWQIDPFGHSREMASISARVGFDGLFFARLDYEDKQKRKNDKTMEMVWEASPNLGSEADLFTSVLYNHYSAPPGFCFDILCDTEPFIDDKTSPGYNVEGKISDFVNFVKGQANSYTSNHILVTMGDDFNYQDANMYFKNIDKLIRYTNEISPDINVLYSTPSCYLKALNEEGKTYETKQDDFFPYGSDSESYWTGFYTSRPTLKYYERLSNNFLQVGKQLEAMTQLQQVGDKLMGNGSENLDLGICMYLNISKCEVTENEANFVVTVYNPLSRNISHYVRFPVKPGQYEIKNSQGSEVKLQLVPIPDSVLDIPGKGKTDAKLDLVFMAENIPPMGYHSYYVSLTNASPIPVTPSGDLFIGSEETILLTVNNSSGLVEEVISKGVRIPLEQSFQYYIGSIDQVGRSSGAYVFRPDPGNSQLKPVTNLATIVVYKGDLVDEIHQIYSNWATQVIRVYKEETHAEFEWLMGPPTDYSSIETVSVFTTNLATNSVFYTDSNGRELLERHRDSRPTWDVTLTEKVSGNYYPVTSRVLIRDVDNGNEVAILNDRSQGGSSINNGQIELMLYRRTELDDGFGVGEALEEYAYAEPLVVRGKHYLVIGNANENNSSPTIASVERELAQKKLLQPWLFFTKTALNFNQWQSSHKMEFAGLTRNLPSNIHILTLEPWKENELLLRLEHIMERNEDPELSKPVQVNLQNLFNTFTITEIHETTLAGNQWKEDMNRLVWKTDTERTESSKPIYREPISCPQIDPNKLNVHLVSHSHDDVGWLKTVDQYYYGSKEKFIYSEVVFFWKWWQEQDERTRQVVRGLVNQGRLEFTGGAWSMNDEAVTHYQSIIDHFTWEYLLNFSYVNAAEDTLNVLYSTPSCYIKAVNDYGATYETKVDDFFPYASDPNSYWTGYYTSRPTLKYFERLGNNFLQVSKQLYSMTELGSTGDTPLDSLREAMGILQHHDSITGTEKQHVAEDYAKILSVAIENARDLIVSLNDTTGLINKIAHNEYELPFQQNFYYYEGFVGNNEGSENRSSGAYIFRPRNSTPILVTDKPTVKIYKGPFF
ncbi:hypothetical protein C0J52_08901 [Blattella germanica]|nr:hypothetical protein C0J52_08901 [Blattella germanica]